MDRFEEMKVFTHVVEMNSFSKAAEALGLPASTVSDVIKRSETRLGIKLLDRTTRVVTPTLDGQVWYRKCLRIVSDVEEAEAGFQGSVPRGRLRVDVQGTLARYFMLPRLEHFQSECPGIELVLSEGDRLVDLVREGVDCVVRVGIPEDSDLIARRLALLPKVTVASPAYLARYGTPSSPDDLARHRMVAFLSSQTGESLPLCFTIDGQEVERQVPATFVTTGADTMLVAARLGMGLIQAPRYHMAGDLAAGRLVEVLADTPPAPSPVSALYPRDRQLLPRVRVFLDWLDSIPFET